MSVVGGGMLGAYSPYVVAAYDGEEVLAAGRGPFVTSALVDMFKLAGVEESVVSELDQEGELSHIIRALVSTGEYVWEHMTLKLTGGRTLYS